MNAKTLITIATSLLIYLCSSHAATHNVNPSGNNITSALKNALNDASNGDTILIKSGTGLKLDQSISITKTVIIKGQGKNATKIKWTGSSGSDMIKLNANGVTIQNLTLNGQNVSGQGIKNLGKKNLKITGMAVLNTKGFNVGNGKGYANAGLRATNCTLKNSNVGIGLANRKHLTRPMQSVEKCIVDGCVISGHQAGTRADCANDTGTYATNWNGTIVKNSTITDCQFAVGCTYSKNMIYQDNKLSGGHEAVHIEYRSDNVQILNNEISTHGSVSWRSGVAGKTGDSNIYVEKNGEEVKIAVADDDKHKNGTRNIIVSGNTFKTEANTAVLLREAEGAKIKNNNFRNITSNKAPVALTKGGGSQSTGCFDCVIKNNLGMKNSDAAIAGARNTVNGNTL